MPDQNNENTQPTDLPETDRPQKQLSSLAKWAFRFFILGLACVIAAIGLSSPMLTLGFVGAIFWVPAILLGIAALCHVGWKRKQVKGVPRSAVSILVPVIVCRIWLYFVIALACRLMCGVTIEGLGKSLAIYSNDYGDKFPTSERWCDLLVERADIGLGHFICRGSDARGGESSYAMNKYVADMNMSQLPKDIVVIFETDYGREEKRGSWIIGNSPRNDNNSSVIESNGIFKVIRSDKLDKLRWNQVGGPEILTLDHHGGKGCNILFGDAHIEFVTKEKIPNLRWKP